MVQRYLTEKRLVDYKPYPWILRTCRLNFILDAEKTKVFTKLDFELKDKQTDLVLDGKGLRLISICLNGQDLTPDEYQLDKESLTLTSDFIDGRSRLLLETEVEISPINNKALEGLYQSRSILCTQCEAEGFRHITFYPDRPDVMTSFEVRLQAKRSVYPLLLCNGNLIEKGTTEDDHYTIWRDPFKKPCYLFALVAGDLHMIEDRFVTMGGRHVSLKIHVEERNKDKCQHAMMALKKAMEWDETKYGREYDLDLYQIVVVDDFNSGAMENKSLNIFNSECILASQETTVDDNYEFIEAIVAHEYFHNWSGNRVTLRDWFQLSLKEGFTVFRDSQFTADNRSAAIKRIDDAQLICSAQFAEDDSPIAHPVRPDSYTEIRNFYTLTVYEKGAEVISMLAGLLGWKNFRKGTDLYFSRYDGQAVQVEDFVAAMEMAGSRSLKQFMLWYSQSGTPEVKVTDSYDSSTKCYKLIMQQSIAPSKDQPNKKPMLIPVRLACLGHDGQLQPLDKTGNTEMVIELDKREKTFEFILPDRPVPSLFRNFSAPVRVHYDYSNEQLANLLDNDTDAYSRWNAGQELKTRVVNRLIQIDIASSTFQSLDEEITRQLKTLADIYARLIESTFYTSTDYQALSMTSKLLALPTRSWIDGKQKIIHVDAIDRAIRFMTDYLAKCLDDAWLRLYNANKLSIPYQPDFAQSSARRLKNLALLFITQGTEQGIDIAWQQFKQADNMTDTKAALHLLVQHSPDDLGKLALARMYENWQHEPLVVSQWLEVQAGVVAEDTLDRVDSLLVHPAFDIENPNKVRSLIGVFANRSYTGFHRCDSAGYIWVTNRLLDIDRFNSQVAARLATALSRWQLYDGHRSQAMKNQLEVLQQQDISVDLREVVDKSLS